MGRLVTPMSHEEFEKLTPFQKWLSRNAFWVVPVAMVTFLGLVAAAVSVFK